MTGRRGRVIAAMILREMTTRYGRSAGGYIWAIVEPVAFIVMFSIIFSQIARDPMLGNSFPLFFATGVITFTIYRDISDATGVAFAFNRPLFTYPQITILDAILARGILQFLTQMVVGALVLAGIFILEGDIPSIDFAPVFLALFVIALIGLSTGALNATLFVFWPTWQRVWAVISRPLFLISGVFFTPETLPDTVRDLVLINPIVHAVGLMRLGFYPTYDADYLNWWLMLALPGGSLVLALFLLRKFQGRMIEQ